MNAPPLVYSVSQKEQMARVLFWLFVVIFAVTSFLAAVGLIIIFADPERADQFVQFDRFIWALWGGVLAEVAAGIFALWKNLFGLSAEADVANARNIVAEIIDGLESSGAI